MKIYDINNWYWIVAGDGTKVFSSAVGDYVPTTSLDYQAWLASDGMPTKIDTEENLGVVLANEKAHIPTQVTIQDAYKQALAIEIETVVFRILFNHENRIRVINNQQQITPVQFITAIKSIL